MIGVVSLSWFWHPSSPYSPEGKDAAMSRHFERSIPAILRAHRKFFYPSSWQLRIHHDQEVKKAPYYKVLAMLQTTSNLELVEYDRTPEALCEAMLWRVAPAWDSRVKHLLCRDIDALPTPRERAAVYRWMTHERRPMLHAICDNPAHMPGILMGGMMGLRADKFRLAIRERFPTFEAFLAEARVAAPLEEMGGDQIWLSSAIATPYRDEIFQEFNTLPSQGEPEDFLTPCIGCPFDAQKAIKWYDEHHYDEPLNRIEDQLGLHPLAEKLRDP